MLKVKNLSKTFNKHTVNEKTIFERFSLNIQKGDFVTVIGSNGAGKSTLFNLVSGALMPDEGSIVLEDQDITAIPEYRRSGQMGRVFQDPSAGTAPSMTILENLAMALNKGKKFDLSRGVSKKEIPYLRECIAQLSLGLEEQLNTKVGLLSGGQRQAVSLLMATIGNPSLLLLDEHTAALDPKTSERIIRLTEKIVTEKKITTLMITHNLNQAIALGNRLIMLHQGNVVLDVRGEEKKRLTIAKLLACFEGIQGDGLLSDRLLLA